MKAKDKKGLAVAGSGVRLQPCACGTMPVWQPWLLGGKAEIYCPGCGRTLGPYDDSPICRARAAREWNRRHDKRKERQ